MDNKISTVMLPQQVDSETSASVETLIVDALRPGARVIVDGSEVTYMSAAGVRVFARALHRAEERAPASASAASPALLPIACWSAASPSSSKSPIPSRRRPRGCVESPQVWLRNACTPAPARVNYWPGLDYIMGRNAARRVTRYHC